MIYDEIGFQITNDKVDAGTNTAYLQYKEKQLQTEAYIKALEIDEE